MANEKYTRLVREMKAPLPTASDRTLVVEGVPSDGWPCDQGACLVVARYVMRVAVEQGCTAIEVRRGPQHRHRFDVGDLLMYEWHVQGGTLPAPDMSCVPVNFATVGHVNQHGAELDTQYPLQIAVPTSLSALRGTEKEMIHGK